MIIVLFHALYLFGKYVYENFNTCKEKSEDTMGANQLLNVSEADYSNETDEDFNENVKIKFFPPVYVQRYNTVQSVLTSDQYHGKIHKVIDFGCAELSFAIHLKNTDGVQEIYCIDVDRALLENCLTKVAPLHCDYLSLRTEPLTIHVCEGSIAHNDNQLENTDAVICIELIEHLYPDDLDAFPYNVFGFIKPQVAIVTTPNADFNVLFRLNGFRHFDHKFEWTRAQFQDWATNIVTRYPDYEVSFHGIGSGPGGTEHLGSCSQMAVFHRHIHRHDERAEGVDGLLKTIVSHKYPYRADNRSDEEKILAEAEYYIRLFSSRDEELCEEIPLEKLMFSVEKFRISTEILKSVLEEANWAIAERENGPVVIVPPPSTFSLHSDADFDDFLDNDYRHHEGDDDWDTLEPGAPRSGYFFDRYMERDPENHEEEENWDDEAQDTHRSTSSNLNNESLPNSEIHVSENVDRTSDSQWAMEDLNNEGLLLDPSQYEPGVMINDSSTGTELPGNSFLIGLDSTVINYLEIFNDALNSSSSPLLLSDLSETSHSLGTDSVQSLFVNRNPTLPSNNSGRSSQTEESNTEGSQDLRSEMQAITYANPVSNFLQPMESESQIEYDNDHSTPHYEELSTESQTSCHLPETENGGQNCGAQYNVHLSPNKRAKLLSDDSLSSCLKSATTGEVDCHSARNGTSSISTVEATCLLSREQSLLVDNKDLLLNAQKLLGNEEFVDNRREESIQSIDSVARDCSRSVLLTDQSMSENNDYHDLCSIYLQPSPASNNSLYPRNAVSYLSIKDFSSATDESYKNLNISRDSIDSSYQKCATDLITEKKIESERIKSQDSMSFKSISDCSLDLQPKYTSSPQVGTDIHRIQAQCKTKTQRFLDKQSLHNEKSTCILQTVSPTIQSPKIKDTDCKDTYETHIQKESREALKIHYSKDVASRDENTPNKESTGGKKIDENNAIPNSAESKTVENISPSPSQMSLQSNSDVSLSATTSTGSSNVDKWYAAETNPMYKRDLVALKGGNDKADNQDEETTSANHLSLVRPDLSNDLRPSGISKRIKNDNFPTFDILDTSTGEKSQLQSAISNCKSTPNNEVSTSYNMSKIVKERGQLKYEFDAARALENVESKPFSPESLDTPPNSWSPEIMDSGYPNSTSVHDITPEYELSSIANDRISDSDSASIGEVPVQGFYEFVEVENGDLANNNRDDEGNNVIAFEANDLDDLQPLIDVLENDMENENDIYVLQNGFPLWLLRILEMANPIDLEGIGGQQAQLYPAPLEQAGGDAPNVNADNDEGFDSSSSDDDSDVEDDEADDATTVSSDEMEDHSAENLRQDWRAGGDP